jgi:hypothetical protein
MSHNSNLRTPSPPLDATRWKVFPHISRYPLAIDFESPEDAVIIGDLSESQYRSLKPHLTMSDDSDREKAFAKDLRSKVRACAAAINKKKRDHDGTGASRSTGPCDAMGALCGNPTLENRRHSCSGCGKLMHIVRPCCSLFDVNNDTQLCGKCHYNDGSNEDIYFSGDDEDDDVQVVYTTQASRDMLATGSYEEEEEEEEELVITQYNEEDAFKTPIAAAAPVKKGNCLPKGVPPSAANRKYPPPPPSASLANASSTVSTSTTNSRKRSPNFSEVEDAYITRAWCSATEDSRKGSGQKAQDFNKSLYSKFVSLADEYNGQTIKQFQIPMKDRTQKAIVDRFAKIKKATSQFAGVVSRNKIKSGEDKETHMRRCAQVYEATHKGKFAWLECFEILEHLPKWNAQLEVGDSTKPAAVNSAAKKKNRSRSTGKRQKALSDKIDRMLHKHTASTPATAGGGDRLSAVGGTLNQMTSHMVEQLNFAHWNDEQKATYFDQDAQEKALLQRKRILVLQKELQELNGSKDPDLDNGEGYGDDEEDE